MAQFNDFQPGTKFKSNDDALPIDNFFVVVKNTGSRISYYRGDTRIEHKAYVNTVRVFWITKNQFEKYNYANYWTIIK